MGGSRREAGMSGEGDVPVPESGGAIGVALPGRVPGWTGAW